MHRHYAMRRGEAYRFLRADVRFKFITGAALRALCRELTGAIEAYDEGRRLWRDTLSSAATHSYEGYAERAVRCGGIFKLKHFCDITEVQVYAVHNFGIACSQCEAAIFPPLGALRNKDWVAFATMNLAACPHCIREIKEKYLGLRRQVGEFDRARRAL